jgi:uncharacterized protein (TIGR03083 family)
MTTMSPALTLAEAHVVGFELAREHTQRFLAYVTSLDDAAVAAKVPGSDWTVGETVAHIQSVVRRYTVDRRRVDARSEMAARNAEDVAELGVDVHAAAASIREQLDLLAGAVPHVAPDQQFPFHGGQTITMAGGWGNLLGELLAHGDDIARATGRPFTIPSGDLEILWRFTGQVLERWMRVEAAAHRDTWALRLPFGTIDVEFDHGALRWDVHHPTRADHIIEISDAAEFALTFPYRRRPITDPTTALLATRFRDV